MAMNDPRPRDLPPEQQRCWVVTDGKIGMETQCVGLADPPATAHPGALLARQQRDGREPQVLAVGLGVETRPARGAHV